MTAGDGTGASPFAVDGDDLVVTVRLTPKGGRDAVDGIGALSDGRPILLARVRAAPSEGEANKALIALLAKTFDVPKRAVSFRSGETARLKVLAIAGEGSRAAQWATRFAS